MLTTQKNYIETTESKSTTDTKSQVSDWPDRAIPELPPARIQTPAELAAGLQENREYEEDQQSIERSRREPEADEPDKAEPCTSANSRKASTENGSTEPVPADVIKKEAQIIRLHQEYEEKASAFRREYDEKEQALRRAGISCLQVAVQIGTLLIEVKESLPHGQFGRRMKNLAVGERELQRYMKLAKNWPALKATNPTLMSDLTMTQALRLLPNPNAAKPETAAKKAPATTRTNAKPAKKAVSPKSADVRQVRASTISEPMVSNNELTETPIEPDAIGQSREGKTADKTAPFADIGEKRFAQMLAAFIQQGRELVAFVQNDSFDKIDGQLSEVKRNGYCDQVAGVKSLLADILNRLNDAPASSIRRK